MKFLYFETRDDLFRVDPSKIVFFEADGNCTKVVMALDKRNIVGKETDSTLLLPINLTATRQELTRQLREEAMIFTRVGKQLIVNRNYVMQVSPLEPKLILSDGESFKFFLRPSKDALKKLRDSIAMTHF